MGLSWASFHSPFLIQKKLGFFVTMKKTAKTRTVRGGEYGPHFCVEGFTYLEGGITREYSVMLFYRVIL